MLVLSVAHLLNINDVLRLLGVRSPSNKSHVGGKNNLYVWVDYIFVICRIVRHIKENRGQLGRSITRPEAPVAAAVSLDQQSNPLENFVQGFLHLVGALQLLYELKHELSLLDGGDILVRGRVFHLHLCAEGSSNHISLDFLFVVLLSNLWIVVKELLYSVFVCHVVRVRMSDVLCSCTKLLLSDWCSWMDEDGLKRICQCRPY